MSTKAKARTKRKPGETTSKKAKSRKSDDKDDRTAGEGKLSALDAAAKVLADQGEPMNCKQMVEAMATKGLWESPGGKTPAATLSSSILREIRAKGGLARFKKTDRGKFASVSQSS